MDYLQIFMSVVTTVAASLATWIFRKFSKWQEHREILEEQHQEEMDAIKEALCALCRSNIIGTELECEKEGYAPIYATECMAHLVKSYITLGGNGIVPELYEKFKKLPHTKPEELETMEDEPTPPEPKKDKEKPRERFGPFEVVRK